MKIKYKSKGDKNTFNIQKGMNISISSTVDPCYSFCLPISCFLWKNIMGYNPIVFLTDKSKWDNSKSGSFVLNHLKNINVEYYFIDPIDGVELSTLSRVSRLYSFAMCDKDDYILTGDVDMLPLSQNLFKDLDKKKDFFVLTKYHVSHRYSMCYIGGYCRSWADVMGTGNTWEIEKDKKIDEVNRLLKKDMIEGLGIPHSEYSSYHYDELSFGEKLNSWTGFPDRVKIIRYNDQNRVNLIWDRNESLRNKTDIHVARHGYNGEAWISLQLVLSDIFGNKTTWVQDYRNEFVKII